MSLPEPYYSDESVTIYHGDSLDILPLLGPRSVDAVVTDPPYSSGGAFRGDRARSTVSKYVQGGTKAHRPEFSGDNRDQRSFMIWSTWWLKAAREASKSGALLVCFSDWRQLPTMTDAAQVAGWVWRGVNPWVKGYGRPSGPGKFSNSAEYAIWGSHGAMVEHDAYAPGWFEYPPPRDREHVAQKPVEVLAWLLAIVPPGGVVLDPFLGSGTTLVAARQLGLSGIGIEADERSCEVAARRLERMPRGTERQPSLSEVGT